MNKRLCLLIAAIAFVALLLGALSGCILGLSKEARIDSLLQDLNGPDRSDAYLNFYTGATLYPALDDTYFDDYFPEDSIPYSLSGLDFTSNPVTGSISGSGGTFSALPLDVEFTMLQEGPNWVISLFWMEAHGNIVE